MGHQGFCFQNTFLVSVLSLKGTSGNRVLETHIKSLLLKDPRPQISPQGHREGIRGFE